METYRMSINILKEKKHRNRSGTLLRNTDYIINVFPTTKIEKQKDKKPQIFLCGNTISTYLYLSVMYNFHLHQRNIRKCDQIFLIMITKNRLMTSGCLQSKKFQKKKEIQSNQSAFCGNFSFGRICQIPKYVTKSQKVE